MKTGCRLMVACVEEMISMVLRWNWDFNLLFWNLHCKSFLLQKEGVGILSLPSFRKSGYYTPLGSFAC